MTENIRWKRGHYIKFYATMKIRIGTRAGESIEIHEGEEFEYDGSMCKYAGAEFPQPSLRGAIKNGWASMDEDAQLPDPVQHERKIATSQSVNRDLSRVQRQASRQINTDEFDEDTVLNVSDRKRVNDPRTGKGHITEKDNRRKNEYGRILDVQASDFDQQDGREIGRVMSSPKTKVDVLSNPGAARDIEMRSRDQGYGKFHRTAGSNIVEREGMTIETQVGRNPSYAGGEEDGEVVGQVRHSRNQTAEGDITVSDTSSRSPKKSSVKKTTIKAAKVIDNPKLRIATKIYSDFPEDWNFFAKTEVKMARIEELGANEDLLDALYASESKSMKTQLEKTYPKHFSS